MFQVNIAIPIIVLIISCYLVIAPVVREPKMSYFYGCLFILLGIVCYFFFVRYRKHPGFMGKHWFIL